MLFLKIRRICITNDERQEMIDEMYWLNGFIFNYNDNKKKKNGKKNLKKNKINKKTKINKINKKTKINKTKQNN